jgi:5-methylcytosine-specific restriction endonuclease McrA
MAISTAPLQALSDAELLTTIEKVRVRERTVSAELIAALTEVLRRELYRAEGYASLYLYCLNGLGLSEFEAYVRMRAARVALSYPQTIEMLADGRLTVTNVSLLMSHLNSSNHEALLEAAARKTKREVVQLIARLHPQPAAASGVWRLYPQPGTPSAAAEATSSPPETSVAPPATAVVVSPPLGDGPAVVPLAPDLYKVQVTISREAYEMLCRIQDLMRHVVPSGDPAPIVERALQVLLGDLERRKTAQTERPHRMARCSSGTRYVPAAVRRQVWERDQGQCAFIGARGRSEERGLIELHHVVPYSEGGATTPDNLQLRCRAHNLYEAELFVDTG